MKRLLPPIGLTVLIALAACGDDSGDIGAPSPEPTTTHVPVSYTTPVFHPATTPPGQRVYLSTSVEGRTLVEGSRIRLTLTDDRIGVGAGCNGIGGRYLLSDGVLTVVDLNQTLVGCTPDLTAQDEWLTALLQGQPAWDVAGDTVTISGDDATVVFTDEEVADPDRPFDGTTWEVVEVRDVMAGRSAPPGGRLVFRNGTVQFDSGCNQGTGTYERTAGSLTVGPIAVTERACDAQVMELEAAMLTSLGEPLVVEIHANRMRLIGTEHELILHAT